MFSIDLLEQLLLLIGYCDGIGRYHDQSIDSSEFVLFPPTKQKEQAKANNHHPQWTRQSRTRICDDQIPCHNKYRAKIEEVGIYCYIHAIAMMGVNVPCLK